MHDWSGLLEFVMTAELGSMSKAAEALGITKSSVSKRIAVLEHRLHTQFIHRQQNGIILTRDGESLLENATHILAQLNELKKSFLEPDSELKGEIRISLPLGVGENLVQPVILAFQASYPKVSFFLHFSTRCVDMAKEGYDLCFRLSASLEESVVAKKLWQCPYHLCASPEFIQKYSEPTHPKQLASFPCLAYSEIKRSIVEDWHFKSSVSGEEVSVTPRVVIRTDSVDSLVKACTQGAGILYCSAFFIHQHLTEKNLLPLLTEWVNGSNTLWVTFPSVKSLTRIARLFVDFTEVYFRKHMHYGCADTSDL